MEVEGEEVGDGLPMRTESTFPLRFPCHSLCYFFVFLSFDGHIGEQQESGEPHFDGRAPREDAGQEREIDNVM